MKRGYKIMAILRNLVDGALFTMEILDETWPTGFTRSYYRNKYRKNRISRKDFETGERQEFYNLLSYLKRQGLIEKKKTEKGIVWKITSAGLAKLHVLRDKSTDYREDSDGNLKIIIFDIPEKLRKQRAWLREALRILGFKLLQQSVWIGKKKIPENFLFDLRLKKLMPYIHIMEVGKQGTVKKLA